MEIRNPIDFDLEAPLTVKLISDSVKYTGEMNALKFHGMSWLDMILTLGKISGRNRNGNAIVAAELNSYMWEQGFTQDLENWVPKIGNCKRFGILFIQGRSKYTDIITIYLLIEIRNNILIQCHRTYIDVEKL